MPADSSHSMGINEKIASHAAIVIAKPAVKAASLSFSSAFTSSTHLGIFARSAQDASRASGCFFMLWAKRRVSSLRANDQCIRDETQDGPGRRRDWSVQPYGQSAQRRDPVRGKRLCRDPNQHHDRETGAKRSNPLFFFGSLHPLAAVRVTPWPSKDGLTHPRWPPGRVPAPRFHRLSARE